MKFVKVQDYAMFHDLTDGESAGWTIVFNIYYVKHGYKCSVSARSPTGRIMRSPRDVAKIFPMEDWPPFAKECISQETGDDTNERLF